MNAADTSVVVAAFAPWHEAHPAAVAVVDAETSLPAHCAVEAYSVLTRLPEPFRVPAPVAAEFLRLRFGGRILAPRSSTVTTLPQRLAQVQVLGGAAYDALVAVTVADHKGVLLTLDRRAERTYQLLGVAYHHLT